MFPLGCSDRPRRRGLSRNPVPWDRHCACCSATGFPLLQRPGSDTGFVRGPAPTLTAAFRVAPRVGLRGLEPTLSAGARVGALPRTPRGRDASTLNIASLRVGSRDDLVVERRGERDDSTRAVCPVILLTWTAACGGALLPLPRAPFQSGACSSSWPSHLRLYECTRSLEQERLPPYYPVVPVGSAS